MKYSEVEVYLYNTKVGTLFDDGVNISFYYSQRFKEKKIEISPIKLRIEQTIGAYTNNDFVDIYKQLPGIIRDSLPDTNGELVMNRYFEQIGLELHEVRVLHRLAFIGSRGMGALEYKPCVDSEILNIQKTINESELYTANKQIHISKTISINELMMYIINNASPIGGAKEKVLVQFNKNTKELSYHLEGYSKDGFEPYLLKFDKEEAYKENTKKEFVFMSLAKELGLEVKHFELLKDGDMQHFLIQRFDREGTKKIHMATASALLHKPHIRDGMSYEELTRLTLSITNSLNDVKKLIKQIIFNFMLCVTDDHAKNFSFLMNEDGKWSLSPAYDLIYGLGAGSLKHKTRLAGKNEKVTIDDILELNKQYKINEEELINFAVSIYKIVRNRFIDLCDKVGMSRATKDGMQNRTDEFLGLK